MSKYTFLNLSLLMAIVALVAFIIYDPSEPGMPPARPLTTMKSGHIDMIEISQQNQSAISLRKQRTKANSEYWVITKPLAITANSVKVDRLMSILSADSVRQYTIAEDQLAKFGLDPPQWQIRFNQQVIKLGNTDPINQYRYVMINGRVHLITDRYTHQFSTLPLSFANLELLPVNKDIREIQTPTLKLSRDNGRWQLSPAQAINSQDDINAFIDEWRYAQAVRLSFQQKEGHTPDTSGNESLASHERITVVTGNTPDAITFVILNDNNDFQLVRQDLGVVYHLSDSAGERLLNLFTTK
ncbi:MAG: DUF4340 domain-containing protein [Gammaproteobacteria bacterium]|nr:DUF4340 domain-containing protein [Gammaproteobacteria bacterium]